MLACLTKDMASKLTIIGTYPYCEKAQEQLRLTLQLGLTGHKKRPPGVNQGAQRLARLKPCKETVGENKERLFVFVPSLQVYLLAAVDKLRCVGLPPERSRC